MAGDVTPVPGNKITRAQMLWVVYYVAAVAGGVYCVFFTTWGAKAYAGISWALLIYCFFGSIYVFIKLLVMRYLARHPHAARPMPHPLAPSVGASEIAPAAKMPFFHDDPSRLGRSGIGMPALINFGERNTILLTVFFVAAGCVVHYLSAKPSRGQALQITGFVSASAFYLALLVRYAILAFRWIKRHVYHAPAMGKVTS